MLPPDVGNQKNPSRTVLLATDNRNSVVAEIVDEKTNQLAYSAYGNQSTKQEAMTRIGFNGELCEAQIGWYFLGNGYRIYNTRLMRFHSPDSWSPFGRGGLNPYMYCAGDPVNRSDPTGHGFVDFILGAKRFFSGDPGFSGSGDGRGLAKAAGGLLVNIKVGRRLRPTVYERSSSSHLPRENHLTVPALAGVGALFADFSNTGGFSRSGSGAGSSHASNLTLRSPRRNSVGVTRPAYEPPPSYTGAMQYWNSDTFAASQQGRTFVVNRVVDPRSQYGSLRAPSLEHRVPPPPPTPPQRQSPSPPSSRDSTPPHSRNPSGDVPFWGRNDELTWEIRRG